MQVGSLYHDKLEAYPTTSWSLTHVISVAAHSQLKKGTAIGRSLILFSFILVTLLATAWPQGQHNCRASEPLQQQNVVYGESHGVGLVMDIFTPVGPKNGLAIVDVISGGWSSSRSKIRDHQQAQFFSILCGRGYTVFAIRPGSLPKFTIAEMVDHLQQGVVWVKQHADEYGIDIERIGLTGASAGGHLASLLAVKNFSSTVRRGADVASVRAVAIFFPPTDLLQFGSQDASAGELTAMARRVAFPNGAGDATEEQIRQKLIEISPTRLVTADAPPFLLIHGTADEVVPLEQSQKLIAALREHGVPAELILKEGGGHPWLTIHQEVAKLADWFDRQLGNPLGEDTSEAPATEKPATEKPEQGIEVITWKQFREMQ